MTLVDILSLAALIILYAAALTQICLFFTLEPNFLWNDQEWRTAETPFEYVLPFWILVATTVMTVALFTQR